MGYHRRYWRRYRLRTSELMNFILIFLIILLFFLMIRLVFRSFSRPKLPIEQITDFQIDSHIIKNLYDSSDIENKDFIERLALISFENNYQVTDNLDIQDIDYKRLKKKYEGKKLKSLYQIYEQALMDIKCFPIPQIANLKTEDKPEYFYINTWGDKRTYGGERVHLGIDIMDGENQRGRLPVISMTSGKLEKMGWNEKGGWRVGIRASHGAYFYYAHLDSYAQGLSIGMNIQEGQLLGFMGDTGYSKKPGTVGNFPVHLHIGIMLDLDFIKDETWINPYHILEFIEDKKQIWDPQDYDS